MWEAISAGGSFWNCVFNGQHPGATYDRRNADLAADIYGFMETHEAKLARQEAAADVTVLYSRASNAVLGRSDRQQDGYLTHLMGLEQVLNDCHIQYRLLTDDRLSPEALANTRVLVLTNAACLSDAETAVIREFVRGGGKLLATGRTSLLEPDGKERADYGLGDVFGCSFTGVVKDNTLWGYQYVRAQHPLTRGCEDTSLLASWGPQYLVRTTSGAAETPLSYVPQIFQQPPEKSWLRSYETDYPTLLLNPFGAGESVFFPYGVDRNVWAHGHNDFGMLLGNALDYLLQGRYAVKTNAPSSVHVSLNRSGEMDGSEYVLHLVNTTSAPRRPVLETIPVHELELVVTLPADGRYSNAVIRVLQAEESVDAAEAELTDDGSELRLMIRLPKLTEYAALHIGLEA